MTMNLLTITGKENKPMLLKSSNINQFSTYPGISIFRTITSKKKVTAFINAFSFIFLRSILYAFKTIIGLYLLSLPCKYIIPDSYFQKKKTNFVLLKYIFVLLWNANEIILLIFVNTLKIPSPHPPTIPNKSFDFFYKNNCYQQLLYFFIKINRQIIFTPLIMVLYVLHSIIEIPFTCL